MADSEQTEIEADFSELRFKAKGVYEDFRPLVVTSVSTVNNLLRLLENAVGVPTDFINSYLSGFRKRYQEGIAAIPEERRELPSFRLGCIVIREAVYAAEEPDLQKLFANLLISGSDRQAKKNAHPGFASTINQLTRHDATMLVDLREKGWTVAARDLIACFDGGQNITPIVLANLHRLGFIEWKYRGIGDIDASQLARNFRWDFERLGQDYTHPYDGPSIDVERGLEGATQQMIETLSRPFAHIHDLAGVEVTEYGRMFVEVCLSDGVAAMPE